MSLLDNQKLDAESSYRARLIADQATVNKALEFVGRLTGTSGSALPDTYFVAPFKEANTRLNLSDLQDMPKQQLEDLEQQEKAYYDKESYLRSLGKDDVIKECMSVLHQCDVLEHTNALMKQKASQQHLFYDDMRKQLLVNGHSLVEDMDQTELLHYCVELLGGFVHE